MEVEKIKKIKEQLLAEKSRLEEELGKIAKKKGKSFAPIYPDYGSEEDENAAEVEEYEIHLALDKNLEKLLSETLRAIARIESGDYGKCESCKKEIGYERMEAFPSATLCIECQSKKDNKLVKFFAKFKNVSNLNKRAEKKD